MSKATWNNDADARLNQMWKDGCSASQCAAELNVSRNAIMGRIYRLRNGKKGAMSDKLQRRKTSSTPEPKSAPRSLKESAAIIPIKPKPLPVISEPPPADSIGLADLKDRSCRWPYGDASPYLFCGHHTMIGSPYCRAHTQMAVTPQAWLQRGIVSL